MALVQTSNKDYWQHFGFSHVFLVSLLCLRYAFFRHGPVFVFPNTEIVLRLY